MIDYFVRFVKRFAVLVPGIVIVYFSVHTVFPAFDKRFPLAIAIFFTYVLGAYLLIPALIRVVRVFAPAKHLQSYCVTPDGFASDPINIGIIGSRRELIRAMRAAGWSVADAHTPLNLIRELYASLLNRPYSTAPMSNLYLFGRRQDIGFEMDIEGQRGHRHHVRFWATSYQGGDSLSFGTVDWHKQRRRGSAGGSLWVGAASRDVGFTLIRHNVQVTHMIDPDTDAERELIIRGLRAARLVTSVSSTRLRRPYKLINRAWRGRLHSDGKLAIVTLKSAA